MQKILNLDNTGAKVISLKDKLSIKKENNTFSNKLVLPSTEGHRFIDFDDIIRLESSSNYTKVYTYSNKMYLISRTMKSIMSKLPVIRFIRIHNSHVINVDFIELLSKDFVQLSDQSKIPISRSYKRKVFKFLIK